MNSSTTLTLVTNTFPLAAGRRDVVSRWSINWTEEVNETIRSANSSSSACTVLTLDTFLLSANGTTYTNFSNEWGPGAVCLNHGNATLSGHSRFSLPNNVSVPAGTYSFEAVLTAFTGVYVNVIGNTASSTCNVGTGGDVARLLSVQVY